MAWPLRPAQGQAAAACGRASTSAAVRCRRVQWRGPMPRGHGPQRAAAGDSAATGGAATFQRRRCGIQAGKRTGRWSKGRGSSLRPSIGPRKGGGWTSTRGGRARVRVNGGRWLRARFRPGNDEIGLGKWLRRCGVGESTLGGLGRRTAAEDGRRTPAMSSARLGLAACTTRCEERGTSGEAGLGIQLGSGALKRRWARRCDAWRLRRRDRRPLAKQGRQ